MAIRDPERYFDRRTIKRHLKRGHASEADYQAYLESLPDMSDNILPKDEGGDDDGFEARMGAKAKRGQDGEGDEGEGGDVQQQGQPQVESQQPEAPAVVGTPIGAPVGGAGEPTS